jgi:hypothetical protein
MKKNNSGATWSLLLILGLVIVALVIWWRPGAGKKADQPAATGTSSSMIKQFENINVNTLRDEMGQ